MIKVFNVVYNLEGQEREISFDNIPEQVSEDEFALFVYLKREIAKKENVPEQEVQVVKAFATFRYV